MKKQKWETFDVQGPLHHKAVGSDTNDNAILKTVSKKLNLFLSKNLLWQPHCIQYIGDNIFTQRIKYCFQHVVAVSCIVLQYSTLY